MSASTDGDGGWQVVLYGLQYRSGVLREADGALRRRIASQFVGLLWASNESTVSSCHLDTIFCVGVDAKVFRGDTTLTQS
jgi:hypothetical protein